MTGDLAELYVRYRDINQEGSNNERMRRQTQYIPALISTIRKNTSGIASYYNLYKGEINEEFHVNEEQLRDLLINMFYKSVE